MTFAASPPARLLLWCLGGAGLAQLILAYTAAESNPYGFSAIFWYLLRAYDTQGNALLAAIVLLAFAMRRRPAALAIVQFAAKHPWAIAAAAFPLLCAGSLRVYHDYPLSMDEYAALFQAKLFAAGKISAVFPPELLDRLIPKFFQGVFLSVSRTTGEVSSTYWPGFALLLAPFAWLDIPWAANPAISALTLPAVHRLAQTVTGSDQAGGWALGLTAASPVFVVSAISYYSMPAHLLCNLLYVLLLLQPTAPRAFAAGLIGSVALVLHQPVPHLLFCAPVLAWLLMRGSLPILGALALGYAPLSLLLGVGWHYHLLEFAAATPSALPSITDPALMETMRGRVAAAFTLPQAGTMVARLAGLSKLWTWGAFGLLVLAACGFGLARARHEARLLGAALLVTFVGYFFFSRDQGHGWGFRYLHSAWFTLPVLASFALARAPENDGEAELRRMTAWGIAFSLVAANALRLVQVDQFIDRHLRQVPPLARSADGARHELVFVNLGSGFYAQDMVQNDPFLRGTRMTMVYGDPQSNARLVAQRYPGYAIIERGVWGESWAKQ